MMFGWLVGAADPPKSVLRSLLSVRWQCARNGILRGTPREKRRARLNLAFSFVIVALLSMAAYGFLQPFVEMGRDDRTMQTVLQKLPQAGLFACFWLLLLSAVSVGLHMFYLSQELPLLLASPTPPRTIFLARFAESAAANSGLFVVASSPVLLAYTYARGSITPIYILQMLGALAAFAAIPTAIGVVIGILLMRVLPAGRTRELLGALGIALFAALYFVFSLSVRRFDDSAAVRAGAQWLADRLSHPLLSSGPWAWAGTLVSGGVPSTTLASCMVLLTSSGALLIFGSASIAMRLHWQGWSNAQEAGTARASIDDIARSGFWEERLRWLPGPVRCMFLKDLRTLRRDMRQLSLFFIPLAVAAVFLVNIRTSPELRIIPAGLMVLGLLPILAMICLRIAMSSFVQETRALMSVAAGPAYPSQLLGGKLLYTVLLSLPVSLLTGGMYAWIRGATAAEWWVVQGVVICGVAAFCGIGIGAGVLAADFRNPEGAGGFSAGARLATFLCQMGYVTLLSILLMAAWVAVRHFYLPPHPVYSAAAAAVLLLTAGTCALPLALGARKLRSQEW
jgi:hypothetical protein